MSCPLLSAAARFGDAPALIDGDVTLSFADWHAAAGGAEALLVGLGRGERLGIVDPDHLAVPPVLVAAWRAGVPVVLISRRIPNIAPIVARLKIARVLHGAALDLRMQAPSSATCTRGIATVLQTSGSTGAPRAVAHSLAAHMASAASSDTNIPFRRGHRWRRSLSMSHIGGLALLMRALHGGGAVVFDDHTPVTHLSLVAVQLRRLLDQPALPALAALLVGGGPVGADLIDAAVARGLPVHTTYGNTELASQVTTTPPGASAAQLRTAGRALPGQEVRISAEGELQVRGRTLFSGYLSAAGLDRGLTEDGWYATGDVGRLEDGWLTVLGRRDQMFISGGENIHPEEIERALAGLEGVRAVVVVGVADAQWGARPVAFIDGPADPAALRAALVSRLARFQIPDRFLPWPAGVSTHKPPRAHLQALASA